MCEEPKVIKVKPTVDHPIVSREGLSDGDDYWLHKDVMEESHSGE